MRKHRFALLTITLSLTGWVAEVLADVSLSRVRSTSVPAADVDDVLLDDLDGDDDAELLVATGDAVDVYINAGANTFQKLRPGIARALLPDDPVRLGAGDFDRDGDNDLVVCGAARRRGPACWIVWNCRRETGRLGFSCGRAPHIIDTFAAAFTPLIGDIDGDRDLDILLLPREEHDRAVVVRNDSHQQRGKLTVARGILPLTGPIDDAAMVVTDGSPFAIIVAAQHKAPRLFEYDDTTGTFVDRSAQRGLSSNRARTRAGHTRHVAAGDLNGDGLPDIVVHSRWGTAVLVQDETGVFHQATTRGLTDLRFDAEGIVIEDFNRDGRADIFVAADKPVRSRLFINQTPQTPLGDPALIFSEQGSAIGLRSKEGLTRPSVFREARECDFAIQLALADQQRRGGSIVFTFPDDSPGKTIVANPSQLQTTATFNGACVQGSDGPDTLVGHRFSSVLRGGGGDDTLIARAGLTVMRGGPGIDTFKAAGFTLIQLPADEVQRGEVVDCSDAHQVWIDSPLTYGELKSAGIRFINCGGEAVECDADEHTPGSTTGSEEDSFDCHHVPLVVSTANLGLPPTARALKFGLSLGFVAKDGFGFGSCRFNFDCAALGLDVCLTGIGLPPSSGGGRCYPSDFDGGVGPVLEWCRDPFWARYRYDQLREVMDFDGLRLVIPVTFWLPRSAAAATNGGCAAGNPATNSIRVWHDSIADTMSAAMSFFGRWGVTFDYQFRTFTVPEDSAFVADPDSDRCSTNLSQTDSDPNSVDQLIAQFPDKARPGEINIYLADVGGVSFSKTATVDNQDISVILLRGDATAFGHEMGHGLGLGHPYDNNISASGTDPLNAESRDNWFRRPFPDPGLDRLHACAVDADCTGVDAPPGDCSKAAGQALGYCRNLKKDCAEDGDHLCDTPWDSTPCFIGVDNNLGFPCLSDGDCQVVDSNPERGTAYLTHCGSAGLCDKVECTDSDDCDGGSFCAGGTCVIWRPGIEACCSIHTDRGPGFDHNACYERRPNGTVVPVSGPGPNTYWPLDDNIMSYHKPIVGRQRTTTDGQRDQIVCNAGYRKDLGLILRKPHADGEPCSLRPGDDASSYGDPGYSRLAAHGACASGVCQITHTVDGATAVCVPGSCTDGVKGEGELSLDCGGTCGIPCPTKRTAIPGRDIPMSSQCAQDSDCVSDLCYGGTCEGSCEDGQQNGVEQSTDSGGAGYDHTCNTQGIGDLCRWNEDCTGALNCEGKGNCVLSTDCPVNAAAVACQTSADCVAGKACVKGSGLCAVATCASDAVCPSGACILPAGRCRCAEDGDCPVAGNTCTLTEAFCLDQCVDGRCLGTCELGVGG